MLERAELLKARELAAPTLANVDADEDLEIVVGTASYGVVVFDLPGVRASDARLLWGTGRANALRNGRPVPTGPQPPSGELSIADPPAWQNSVSKSFSTFLPSL